MPNSFSYDSCKYYFDLLALSLLLAPLFYLVKGETAKRALLTLGGMYALYFIAARLLLFYLVFWCGVFVLQRVIARLGHGFVLAVSVIAVLSPMAAWKIYGDTFNLWFNITFNSLLQPISWPVWEIDMTQSLLVPVGISFAAFRAIDLLVKTWLGKLPALGFDKVMFYGFFAPVQVAGPISEYDETAQLPAHADPQKIYEGLIRIATGFIKVFVLSTLLAGSAGFIASPEGLSTAHAWFALIAFSWYFYLNFSGYADIAIGIAKIYGFDLRENFAYPLLFRRNLQQYWAHWHMSLTRFAERNIFVPCGGYRPKSQYFAILVTMLAIGLWHNFNSAALFYGFYHGGGLIAQRLYARVLGAERKPGRIETVFYHLLTYLFVSLGYPLLFVDSLGEAMVFYKTLARLP